MNPFMKPFNAESASLGDPVIAKRFGRTTIEKSRYLAKLEDGRHVVEFQSVSGASFVEVVNEDQLFAVPKKKTIWVNIYPDYPGLPNVGGKRAVWHDNEEDARAKTIVDAIAVAVPIEIIEE